MTNTLKQLLEEKDKIERQAYCLTQERKQAVAWLAEQYGLLTWPNEELCLAFEKIAATHERR